MTPTSGPRKRAPGDPANLVGHNEIADMYGVKVATVHKWKQRFPDFPQPFVELAMGPVFWKPDVEAWFSKRWS